MSRIKLPTVAVSILPSGTWVAEYIIPMPGNEGNEGNEENEEYAAF